MSSYLTTTNIESLTGSFYRLWETMAYSSVIVHKEPIRTLTAPSGVTWAGFEESSNPDNYSYQVVTGIFPVIIKDGNKPSNGKELDGLNIKLTTEQVIIKVQRDARDFLESSKTEKLELNDGRVYNNFSLYSTQNYFGLMYYYYLLDRTT